MFGFLKQLCKERFVWVSGKIKTEEIPRVFNYTFYWIDMKNDLKKYLIKIMTLSGDRYVWAY